MKKKLLFAALVLIIIILTVACDSAPESGEHYNEYAVAPEYGELSYDADIYKVLYALQNPESWVVLDVRTKAEFEGDPTAATEGVYGFGRIAGAVHIEWSEALDEDNKLLPEDELRQIFSEVLDGRSIIAYCRSGRRSAHTQDVLSSLGVEVLTFSDGWIEWSYTASYGAPQYRDLVLTFTEEWTQAS